jgi:hypothetical protein
MAACAVLMLWPGVFELIQLFFQGLIKHVQKGHASALQLIVMPGCVVESTVPFHYKTKNEWGYTTQILLGDQYHMHNNL